MGLHVETVTSLQNTHSTFVCSVFFWICDFHGPSAQNSLNSRRRLRCIYREGLSDYMPVFLF